MRYKRTPELIKGNVRVFPRFLWLPLTIGEETRWLEMATVREESQQVRKWFTGTSGIYWKVKWVAVAFIEKVGYADDATAEAVIADFKAYRAAVRDAYIAADAADADEFAASAYAANNAAVRASFAATKDAAANTLNSQ